VEVAWGGDVGVAGGTGVAVGTIGVDISEWGEGVASGVSAGAEVELVALVSASGAGVQDPAGMTASPLPLVNVEKAA
jgi:hypothetical protein